MGKLKMGSSASTFQIDPENYVRDGVDIHDVMKIKKAFDELDTNHQGKLKMSKLQEEGFPEALFSQDEKMNLISKEQADPFPQLENKSPEQDREPGVLPMIDRTEVSMGCMSCESKRYQDEERFINFEDFFEVMVKKIVEEKAFSKDIDYESNVSNVSCFFWNTGKPQNKIHL
eukprot:TRINITY_DN12133_c0_g1_i4.p1 TRINITY_DN12133_c0_g1~~TRINITY_DN12133_c0_g1_i4.p1  ORF type:complete len:173 (+),score=32.98 TRINITY_DN12133_c0_g1_i4:214-732(+)